ncbi:hypothetical protein [Spiroplasma endosymbiont of Labia minor]|uniref:hypothetical protein n=1 Tax=Spiroplasma endosymbiont of Labia minor TaxID=3066305 RepID=UPI0030D3C906
MRKKSKSIGEFANENLIPYTNSIVNIGKIKIAAIDFFDQMMKWFEYTDNDKTILYTKFSDAKAKLQKGFFRRNLDSVKSSIESFIDFIIQTDRQFISYFSTSLSDNSKNLISNVNEITNLVNKYNVAVQSWDLVSAEYAIEKIYAIALNNKMMLPKVGYCIKYKLENLFLFTEGQNSFIQKMEGFKIKYDYESYKNTVSSAILAFSPNKKYLWSFFTNIAAEKWNEFNK